MTGPFGIGGGGGQTADTAKYDPSRVKVHEEDGEKDSPLEKSLAARMVAIRRAAEGTGVSKREIAFPHRYIRLTLVGSFTRLPPFGASSISVMISTPKRGTTPACLAASAKPE